MLHSRRISVSSVNSVSSSERANVSLLLSLAKDSLDVERLCSTPITEIPEEKVFQVNSEISVDAACDIILEKGVSCLTVQTTEAEKSTMIGLFDFTDVNAFLTLAATSHLINEEDIDIEDRVARILESARSGKVPVKLCTDLSDKNPLLLVSQADSVLTLLELFSRGAHRVVVNENSAVISATGLLEWLVRKAYDIELLRQLLEQSVWALELGSKQVISSVSTESVLDAMRTMSEQGLSSIAVTDTGTGDLLSTVTVMDITRIVAPSQSKKILTTPLSQFIALIKAPEGYEDGVDKYPVYSVLPNSTLNHVIQKLLATNAYRIFITDELRESTSVPFNGNLRGVVSVVDVLSFFARLVGISCVDPTRMQRDRRASTSSSSSRISRRPSSRLSIVSTNIDVPKTPESGKINQPSNL